VSEFRPTTSARPLAVASDEQTDQRDAPLEFGQFYYQHDCGIPYERSDEWLGYFDLFADRVVAELAPSSVLDAGCAIGLLVEKLRERGVEAWGIDISEYAIAHVEQRVQPYCFVGSIADELPAALPDHFDLVTCIEVVEHMRPGDSANAIARLADVGDRILFSSSPTDYGETTHVNVRQPEVWSALFARHGQLHDVDFDGRFLTPWAMLYERGPRDLGAVVERYDSAVVRLKDEIGQVRETALRLQNRVAELESADAGKTKIELEAARIRVQELEQELADMRRILGTRSGRWLRAWHTMRSALGKPV
jgi:SAM-dependent methyltransferase